MHVQQLTINNSAITTRIFEIDESAFGYRSITIWTLEAFFRFGEVIGFFLVEHLIGFCLLMKDFKDDSIVYIVEMAIDKGYQGKGIGTEFLSEIISKFQGENVDMISLHVDPESLAAIHVYRNHFGFKIQDYRSNEYGPNEDRLFMVRSPQDTFRRSVPWKLVEDDIQLINISREIIKSIRTTYYNHTPRQEHIRTEPFYGFVENGVVRESLGPFPEYILPTFPCNNTVQGYCSPCFFSNLPLYNVKRSAIYQSLVSQTEFILNNFSRIMLGYQLRPADHLRQYDAVFCYATNGSFFSNYETTAKHREKALSKLAGYASKHKLNLLMYLEVFPADLITAYQTGELNRLLEYLKILNTVIFIGLESVNDFTREVIYNKKAPFSEITQVIEINKQLGLDTGAFICCGFHSMTENEIISDVENTLYYLKRKQVLPILMFPNMKEFSLTHLLHKYKRYRLIDPRTALRLVTLIHQVFENSNIEHRDKWLTGDVWGGPPKSVIDVFSGAEGISCESCSEIIANGIMRFRMDHDFHKFSHYIEPIHSCRQNCDDKYRNFLAQCTSEKDLRERVRNNLIFAKEKVDTYCSEILSLKS